MVVIDWLHLKPAEADFESASRALHGVADLRTLLRALVRALLLLFPWDGREDVVPLFDPSRRYAPGDGIALLRCDPETGWPATWSIGTVRDVAEGYAAEQGSFQVVTVETDGRKVTVDAGLAEAQPPRLNLPLGNPEILEWLAADTVDRYWESLVVVLLDAIDEQRLRVVRLGDRVLRSDEIVAFGAAQQTLIGDILRNGPAGKPPGRTAAETLAAMREADCLQDVPDEVAGFSLEHYFRQNGFRSLSDGRWWPAKTVAADGRTAPRPQASAVEWQAARAAAGWGGKTPETTGDEAQGGWTLSRYKGRLAGATQSQLPPWTKKTRLAVAGLAAALLLVYAAAGSLARYPPPRQGMLPETPEQVSIGSQVGTGQWAMTAPAMGEMQREMNNTRQSGAPPAAGPPAGSPSSPSPSQLASVLTPAPTRAGAAPTPALRPVGRVLAAVVMRAGPASGSPEIASLARGTEVEIIEQTSEDWLKVRAGQREGYVWSKFVGVEKSGN